MICLKPNPDEPVGAKRKSRFIGEPKMINHENTKFEKHEIFLFFRVFACPVKPFFPFNRGPFVLS
jgi:hypothetical protein